MKECDANLAEIHEEIRLLADNAVSLIQNYANMIEEIDDYVIRAAIHQTLVERRAVPEALMRELVRHVKVAIR